MTFLPWHLKTAVRLCLWCYTARCSLHGHQDVPLSQTQLSRLSNTREKNKAMQGVLTDPFNAFLSMFPSWQCDLCSRLWDPQGLMTTVPTKLTPSQRFRYWKAPGLCSLQLEEILAPSCPFISMVSKQTNKAWNAVFITACLLPTVERWGWNLCSIHLRHPENCSHDHGTSLPHHWIAKQVQPK